MYAKSLYYFNSIIEEIIFPQTLITDIFSFCASFCDQVQVYKLTTKVCCDVNTGASVPPKLYLTIPSETQTFWSFSACVHTHIYSQHSSHSRIWTNNILMFVVDRHCGIEEASFSCKKVRIVCYASYGMKLLQFRKPLFDFCSFTLVFTCALPTKGRDY